MKKSVISFLFTIALIFSFVGPTNAASGFDSIHRGDTRAQVNHKLHSHGEKLWGYRDNGQQHRVRRYPTDKPHVWVVIDYKVRPHALRVFFKSHCTWTPDGVECSPGASS